MIIYSEEAVTEFTDRLDVPSKEKRRVMDDYKTSSLTNQKEGRRAIS